MSELKYNKEKLYPTNVTIYTEANPNPHSMKFMLSFMLVHNGESYDFPDAEAAKSVPLAEALFAFSYVKRVFLMSNFVTITKSNDVDWLEVTAELKTFLKNYFESNKPIFSENPQGLASEDNSQDSEAVQKIKVVLDEYVRPAVEGDGGAIVFRSFDEETGVVRVQLQGSCSGCPSSTITLKNGIENLLKRMVPTVKEVVAENV